MKKLFSLLVVISLIFVFASCSLIGSPTTTPVPVSNYPESVVYKIELSNDTYLCTLVSMSVTLMLRSLCD